MPSLVHRIWADIVHAIRSLFRRQRALGDLTLDELRAERVHLEVAEHRILRDLERLEDEKAALFEAAKREQSMAVRQVQARKIRDATYRITTLQGNLRRIGKLSQVVDSLIARYELGRLEPGTSPIVDALYQENSQTLQDWVEDVVAGETVMEEKIDTLITTMEDAERSRQQEVAEDAEVSAILAEIEQAAAREALAQESALEPLKPGRERSALEAEGEAAEDK